MVVGGFKDLVNWNGYLNLVFFYLLGEIGLISVWYDVINTSLNGDVVILMVCFKLKQIIDVSIFSLVQSGNESFVLVMGVFMNWEFVFY